MVPLCERRATGPSFARTILSRPWNAQSSRLAALNMPMQLGPMIRMRCFAERRLTSAS